MGEPPHPETSPDELLPRIAAGDAAAFAALYRKHAGEVFRFALHMTGSRSVADDVTQDVFLAVMREASRYTPGVSGELAWLRGIARNHVRRRVARDRSTVALDPEDVEGAAAAAPAPREPGPLGEMLRSEQIEALRRTVASLPVRYREVVVLCDLQELSYADAAGVLGCAVGTVRSRLSRARDLLASKLAAGYEADAGDRRGEHRDKVRARWAI